MGADMELSRATPKDHGRRFVQIAEALRMGRLLSRYALSMSAAGALLAACGTLRQGQGNMPPIIAPGTMPRTAAAARVGAGPTRLSGDYHVLYRFNLRDGVGSGHPLGGLLNSGGGTLYGTTQFGGRLKRGGCCGTVYSITTTGTYNTLYAFRGQREGDGAAPQAGLVFGPNGMYGTTASGGSSNRGTVYSITTSGQEKILHSFTGGSDGAYPASELLYYNYTLYGTTSQGGYYGSGCGSSGCGTVYSITTSGAEKVLYAFKAAADGETPSSALIVYTRNDAVRGALAQGTMYGTTAHGGGTGCGGSGCGTVYSITKSGQEHVLYAFKGGSDGSKPEGLDDLRGTLYGTTVAGGTGCRGSGGCGTVYSISAFSDYKNVVYDFRGGSDGACPNGPLIDIVDGLYGTTACGGGCSAQACGTIYGVTPTGTEHVLYRFTDSADGFSPDGPLTNTNFTFYGTTLKGGGPGKGYGRGVIFALSP